MTNKRLKDCGKMEEVDKKDVCNILNKNFPSAICQHCKKVTNIQFSNDFRKLVARNKTLSEINETLTVALTNDKRAQLEQELALLEWDLSGAGYEWLVNYGLILQLNDNVYKMQTTV